MGMPELLDAMYRLIAIFHRLACRDGVIGQEEETWPSSAATPRLRVPDSKRRRCPAAHRFPTAAGIEREAEGNDAQYKVAMRARKKLGACP